MFLEKKISLVIPAKNEAQNIARVLTQIPEFVDEIIVVTSSAQDTTMDSLIALKSGSKLVSIIQDGAGKGDAQRKGLSRATGDFICMIDADGSVNMNELDAMLDCLIRDNLDLLKGSRYLMSGGSEDLTKIRSFGNLALTKIANVLFLKQWTDLAYGFITYRRDSIVKLRLEHTLKPRLFFGYNYGSGFELETIILSRMARNGFKIKEFPSFELKRLDGFSNLRAMRDGLRILLAIIYERFSPRD